MYSSDEEQSSVVESNEYSDSADEEVFGCFSDGHS